MANKFHVNTVLLSGQPLTASATDLYLNNNRIANASETGQFVTTAQTGHIHSQYALSAGTGQFISTAQTGQFAPSGLTGQFITTAQTGHIHAQYVLASSTGQFIDTSDTGIFVVRGETGNAFYPRFGNPAGYVTSAVGGGGITGVTGISVSGSIPLTGLVNISGGSGILATLVDQQIVISVSPSNLTTVSGIGGVQVISSGTFLLVSGGSSTFNDDGTFVHTTGIQIISGEKTFVNDLKILGFAVDIDIYQTGGNHVIWASGVVDDYNEINVYNLHQGQNASADLVVSNSTDLTKNYVDLGINSIGYTGATCGYTGDGYLYSFGGDFYVGSITPNRAMGLFAGHQMTGNTAAQTGRAELLVLSGKVLVGGYPVVTSFNTGQFVDSSETGQFVTTAMTGRWTTSIFSGSGTLLQVTGKILSGIFLFTGSNIIVSTDVNTIYLSGSGVFPAVTLLAQTGEYIQTASASNVDVFCKLVANRPIPHVGNSPGSSYPLGPAFWGRQIAMTTPGSFQNMAVVGHATPTNLGTVTHSGSFFFGYGTNFQTAATMNATAGHSYSGANFFLGTGDLRSGTNQGFFYTCQFALPDNSGSYITGSDAGTNKPSGVRIFVGMTDQTLATILALNTPTGCRVGFSFVRSTGIMVGQQNRNDTNWQFVSCDNNLEIKTDTSIPFNTGMYQIYINGPSPPSIGKIYWKLEDQTRGFTATGVATARLPIVGTPLRPAIGICNVSGVKNLLHFLSYVSV